MRRKFARLHLKLDRYRRVRFKRQVREVRVRSRHPYAVPFITIGVLAVLTGGIYLVARGTHHLEPPKDSKIVIISHDHVQQIVPTRQATVGSLLARLHLTLNPGDVVEPAPATPIKQDQFRINIYRALPVEIVDGNNKAFTFSAATTGRAIAQQVGVSLFPEDVAQRDPVQDFLREGSIGEQVVVKRATPVNVDLYGSKVVLRTQAKTIAELIKEKNIKVFKKDQIVPAPDTPITPGQQISFIRTGIKVQTDTETIPMPVQTISDNSLAYGTSAVRQQGASGQQVVTYQISLNNNVETGRSVIQKVITRQPVTQIVVVGTSLSGIKGDMALAGIGPGEYNSADFIIGHESHWNPGALNGSGCAGLGQACPGSKLAYACPGWQNDPVCQLRFFTRYASKYGGWNGAAAFWRGHGYW